MHTRKPYLSLVSVCVRLEVFIEQSLAVKITQLHVPDEEVVTSRTSRDPKLPF